MSDFLFVMPSFGRGFARTLDVGAILSGSSYNVSLTGDHADAWAIGEDWAAVGRDLAEAMNKYGLDGEEEEEE